MRRVILGAVVVMGMALAVTVPALAADTPAAATAPVALPAAPTAAMVAAPVAPAAAQPAAPAVVQPAAPAVVRTPLALRAASPVASAAPMAASAPTAAPIAAPATETAIALPAANAADVPLALRPATPLALAAEPTTTPWPYKFMFGAALLAAGALVWKKRKSLSAKQAPGTPVRVLGKTSMGLRGELALVEVGGMRLLVGVTPSSMQTLAVLPDDYAESAVAEGEATQAHTAAALPLNKASAPRDLASRARALFASIDVGPPVPPRLGASTFAASRYADERDSDGESTSAPAPKSRESRESRDQDRRRRPSRDIPLEGQARGIALALGNRK